MFDRKELIVIACSKSKRKGGAGEYSPSPLADLLSEDRFRQLMKARKNISEILNLSPGPDLGTSAADEKILFLPAYQRYSGIVYKENDFDQVYPGIASRKVIIISALYGVLDASEFIRNYELKMDHKLPIGVRVTTWWKNCLLYTSDAADE